MAVTDEEQDEPEEQEAQPEASTKERLCISLPPRMAQDIQTLKEKTGITKSKLLELAYSEPLVFDNLRKLEEIDALRKELEELTEKETEGE